MIKKRTFEILMHIEDDELNSEVLTDSEDSDEDMFTVPDVESTPISVHSAVTLQNNNINQRNVTDPQFQTSFPGKRRRGRNPADKEHRRLKRYKYTYYIFAYSHVSNSFFFFVNISLTKF